jgi:hypothetical protein
MDRLIVDIRSSGVATVTRWVEGEMPHSPIGPFKLLWPLADDETESLRWYVEDFLPAPFGVYDKRGPTVQGSLPGWGEQIFSAVFGTGPVRDAFVAARAKASSGRGLEVVFQSSAPGWLGLPWELMWQPGDPEPLVLNGVSVARALPTGVGVLGLLHHRTSQQRRHRSNQRHHRTPPPDRPRLPQPPQLQATDDLGRRKAHPPKSPMSQ